MRVTLIHNPTAGDEDHDRETLVAAVAAAGHQAEYRSAKEDDWEKALATPPDLVAVAGGDGTVANVFKRLVGTTVPATVIPLGSANNIADTLGFAHLEVEQLVRAWPTFVLRPYDVGEAAARWGRERFVESAGGGVFGELFARAENAYRNDAEDKVQSGLELLRDVLSSCEAGWWDVDLDGRGLSGELIGVEALTVREAGPEIRLAPDADPTDGLLDIVLISPDDRDLLRTHVETCLAGRRPPELVLTAHRGRRLTVGAPAANSLHVDDDPYRCDGTVVIQSTTEHVHLLVPPGATAQTDA